MSSCPDPRVGTIARSIMLGVIAILAVGCSGTAAPASPTPDAGADKLAQVLGRGTLVGYAELDYPPQSILVPGAQRTQGTKCQPNQRTAAEVTGFDIETTKLVAKDLGVEACFVSPTWTEVTAGSWSDRWDIVYGSGSINADRMKRLWMTQPYYATPNMFFVKSDSPYKTADQLSGKKVGSCASCTHEYYLKHTLEIPGAKLEWDIKDPRIVAFETEGPGLQALANGEIDAFLCAAPVGQAKIDEGLKLRPLEKPAFTFFPSGFVDKGSGKAPTPFVNRVNEIIRTHQADGSLKALSLEWFTTDYVAEAAAFDLAATGQVLP
jgi:polar amino acid transport system substrate-binding protein